MSKRDVKLLFNLVVVVVFVVLAYTSNRSSAASTSLTTTTNAETDVYAPVVQTRTTGCVTVDALPDAACTPGAVLRSATKDQICTPGYSKGVRNVPESEKQAVYAEYGILSHAKGQYEVDHLISLELGGSNDIANLWPEPADPTPGFHQKDGVENALNAQVCSGSISLAEAQRMIATNWLSVLSGASSTDAGADGSP